MGKIQRVIWGTLTVLCLAAVFTGAWWHIATAAISYGMYNMSKSEEEAKKS